MTTENKKPMPIRTKGDSKKPIFAPAQSQALRDIARLVTVGDSIDMLKVAKNLFKLADYLESDERKAKTKKAVEKKNRHLEPKQ